MRRGKPLKIAQILFGIVILQARCTFQTVIHTINIFESHLVVGVTNVSADFVILKSQKANFYPVLP
jgi:hypothetical protein